LIGLLEEMSVPVNMCLLPDIGIDLLSDYLRGQAAVVYPHASWEKLADKVLAGMEVPWQVLPAPHGVEATLEWCRAAAGSIGLEDRVLAWERERLPAIRREWDSLRKRTRGLRLAFVVDRKSRARLNQPSRLYGFEILGLLEEMGFDVQVLTLGEEFSNRGELAGQLHHGDFQAVYSEIFFDSRLTRAGKAQFNLSMLEMGFDGALRSIRRLQNICRLPFYRRYHAYLGGRS
jgi:hypothetical protein